MMATSSIPPRRNRLGIWFVVLLGLLEIAAAIVFFEYKPIVQSVCAFSGVAPGGPDVTASAPAAVATSVAPAVSPMPDASADAASASGQNGDAAVSGDTNQIVDPNCVAKTAAGLLTSGTAPPAGPTCPPMQQPAALKDAEKQISH